MVTYLKNQKNSDISSKNQHKSVTSSKKNYEYIWKSVFLFILMVSLFLFNKIYIYQTHPFFDNIRKGQLLQLLFYGIPFGIIFILSQKLMHSFLDEKCLQCYINKNKYKTEEAQTKRSYTIIKWFNSIFFYIFSSFTGYYLIKQTTLMPTWLGGDGYCTDLSRYVNYFQQAHFGMKLFYILQFGKHLGRLFQHVFIRSEGNFYEYALHHGLSTFLIFFSYLMNMWLIGIFVLLIHDVSDIVLLLSRGYRDYKRINKFLLHCMDIFGGFIWIFCRIFLLSYCCVYSSISTVFNIIINKQQYHPIIFSTLLFPGIFMAFMLLALQILQIFWTYYITQSFIEFNISSNIAKHTYD